MTHDTDTADAASAAAADTPSLLDAAPAAAPAPPRPDFLPEQFWDGEKASPRLEALVKSWKDSRAAAIAKAPARADDYKLPLPEGAPAGVTLAALVKPDDPLLAAVRKAAHEAGMSQAQFDAMARPVMAKLAAAAAAGAASPQPSAAERAAAEQDFVRAELAKLGPTAEAQVTAIATWGEGLVRKNVLSQEEFQEFRYAAGTAAGLRMLAKLRDLAAEQPLPLDAGASASADQGTLADYYRLMASDKADDKAKARRLLETLDRTGLLPSRPPAGMGVR